MYEDDEAFVRKVGQLYNVVMAFRKDEDYEVNQPQFDKLVQLYRFFQDMAQSPKDEVEDLELVPRKECSGITAKFFVFSLNGVKQIQEFCNLLQCCSAFGADALVDGRVCVGCTVPNVFVPRKNNLS